MLGLVSLSAPASSRTVSRPNAPGWLSPEQWDRERTRYLGHWREAEREVGQIADAGMSDSLAQKVHEGISQLATLSGQWERRWTGALAAPADSFNRDWHENKKDVRRLLRVSPFTRVVVLASIQSGC